MPKEAQVPDDVAPQRRPLIFVVGSEIPFDLPSQIKNIARSKYHAEVEVGSSSLTVGETWTLSPPLPRRARVVVVLISEDLVRSKAAESGLREIDSQTQREQEILPVLLDRCQWQEIDILNRWRMWNPKEPLNELPREWVDREISRLVEKILQLAGLGLPVGQSSSAPRFAFSRNAASVIARSQDLAKQSDRKAANCSCILFGLSELASNSQATQRFVRQALDAQGKYADVFEHFLGDTRSKVVGRSIEGLTGLFSGNARRVLEDAETIATHVGHTSKEIHTRHLFGALITGDRANSAKRRVERCGIQLPELANNFLAFLEQYSPEDDLEEWRKILGLSPLGGAKPQNPSEPDSSKVIEPAISEPAPSTYTSGTPGYNSEFCGLGGASKVSDYLKVNLLAGRLAELISLTETRLPLAIGLFGNWGCGKSHFMNLIDLRIKSLTQEAHKANGVQSPWCREIVPIYFNAWHYSDSNLWASLVTEVFDSLFAHIQPKDDELELLKERLSKAGGVTSLAEEQVKTAKDNVTKAEKDLESATARKNSAGETLKGLLEGLKTETAGLTTAEDLRRIAELLGVPTEDATLPNLVARARELASIAGRVKDLWRRAVNPRGLAVRLGWLSGAVIAVVIIYAVRHWGPVESLLRAMGPLVRNVLIALAGITAWLTPLIRQVQAGLTQLGALQKRAEDAQAILATDPRVVEAKNAKVRAEAKALAAEQALSAAKSEELSLKEAVENLRPERRLGLFIETRARSADYRGQLGLVSLARRDFNELSKIFTDAESIKKEMVDKPKQIEGLERLSLRVDRVVLFIDDLDRCDPEKVVDVLQAVHLLLAYPLFAVVVGVDQRVLRQSLHARFRGVGQVHGVLRTAGVVGVGLGEAEEGPATPLDYLEKIFHIPFHLPRMDKTGFETLVWNLTEPAKPSINPEEPPDDADSGRPTQSGETAVDAEPGADPVEEEKADEAVQAGDALSGSVIGSVPLDGWERNALKDYYRLIPTPRGATRFLNTYRLVRAGVLSTEWDQFRGDQGGLGEFRLPMLLLAVAAGQPSVAREWFRLLQQQEGSSLPQLENLSERDASAWEEFRRLYSVLDTQVNVPITHDRVMKWISFVERFTF